MFVKCLIILSVLSVSIKTIDGSNLTLKRYRRDNGECGIPLGSTSLIIRGINFQRGAWPWMVAILVKTTSPPSFICGGVLVSRTKVITGELNIQVLLKK